MSAEARRGRWAGGLRTRLVLLASLVPPTLVTWAVLRYGRNVPYGDQWGRVPLVVEAVTGKLRFATLWEQINEHRCPVPGLLIAVLARFTGWDVRSELVVDVLLAGATAALLAHLIVRTVRSHAPAGVPGLVLVVSLFTFSLAQGGDWTSGTIMVSYACVLGAVGAAWALGCLGGRWSRPVLATGGAVGAALSFGAGLPLLLLVPITLLAAPPARPAARRALDAGLAGVLAAIVLGAYLTGWHPRSGEPPPRLLPMPGAYADFVLAFLGAGLGGRDLATSMRWGAILLALLVVSLVNVLARAPARRAAVLPWGFLAAWIGLAAAVTAFGRLRYGLSTAVAARYAPVQSMFPICVTVVLALAASEARSRGVRRAALVLVGMLAVPAGRDYVHASRAGVADMAREDVVLARAAPCLANLEWATDACLRTICWDANLVRLYAPALRDHRLTLYATVRPEPPLASYQTVAAEVPVGRIDAMGGAGPSRVDVLVTGWAVHPVLVAVDGQIAGRVDAGPPARPGARWLLHFRVAQLAPGPHRLEAYALLGDGRIAPLAGGRVFSVGAS